MKLVLQCANCGIHHPVGTPVCTACRASGVAQMRLMFECPRCGQLGLNLTCATCPPLPAAVFEPPNLLALEGELMMAEEIEEDPHHEVFEDFELVDEEEDEVVEVDFEDDIAEEDEDGTVS